MTIKDAIISNPGLDDRGVADLVVCSPASVRTVRSNLRCKGLLDVAVASDPPEENRTAPVRGVNLVRNEGENAIPTGETEPREADFPGGFLETRAKVVETQPDLRNLFLRNRFGHLFQLRILSSNPSGTVVGFAHPERDEP